MSRGYYRHYVPKEPLKEDFPFKFNLTEINESDITGKPDLEINYIHNDSRELPLKTKIKEGLIHLFPFHIYADKHSQKYNKTEDLSYKVKVNVFVKVKENEKYTNKLLRVFGLIANNFYTEYSFTLVKDLDMLRKELENRDKIAFDTETTGLDPENDYIVGVSLSFKPKEGYYVPIAHSEKYSKFNLGREALDIIYDALVKAEVVYMFNARFDMRMFEYTDEKYDLSKVNVIDSQVNAYLTDPGYKETSLKTLETHFLGYNRPDLKTTLRSSGVNSFTFADINPEKGLFYASQDAISTFELGEVTMPYFKETGVSGQIDQKLLYRLMKMENSGIRVDVDYLKEQLDYIIPRLKELDNLIKESIGDINLNSSSQRQTLFESFGLDTGVRTKTGAMSTSRKAVDDMIERLDNRGEDYPEWLKYLGERSKLEKLNNTFFSSLYEQAILNNNRVRLNYRNVNTATGRLSSGREEEE